MLSSWIFLYEGVHKLKKEMFATTHACRYLRLRFDFNYFRAKKTAPNPPPQPSCAHTAVVRSRSSRKHSCGRRYKYLDCNACFKFRLTWRRPNSNSINRIRRSCTCIGSDVDTCTLIGICKLKASILHCSGTRWRECSLRTITFAGTVLRTAGSARTSGSELEMETFARAWRCTISLSWLAMRTCTSCLVRTRAHHAHCQKMSSLGKRRRDNSSKPAGSCCTSSTGQRPKRPRGERCWPLLKRTLALGGL